MNKQDFQKKLGKYSGHKVIKIAGKTYGSAFFGIKRDFPKKPSFMYHNFKSYIEKICLLLLLDGYDFELVDIYENIIVFSYKGYKNIDHLKDFKGETVSALIYDKNSKKFFGIEDRLNLDKYRKLKENPNYNIIYKNVGGTPSEKNLIYINKNNKEAFCVTIASYSEFLEASHINLVTGKQTDDLIYVRFNKNFYKFKDVEKLSKKASQMVS